MKACPFCSKEMPDQVMICPHCGQDLAAAAAQAAAQLRAVGYSTANSVLWIAGYVLLTTLVRALILYSTAPALRHWSVVISGVTSLAIIGYGVFRAHQQKRSAIKTWL
jgi:hypothetical protein